jgi:ectoine hydroxylase-related dioxygenase (phytanoyl-CoA dioxygenase family)
VIRHPLNREFVWRSPVPPFRIITEAQAKAYDEQGYFVLEHAFDPAATSALTAEIDPIERAAEDRLRQIDGGKVFIARADEITFTTHLVEHSQQLRRFVAEAPLADLCADLIGPDVRLYWDQAVYKKPDTAASFPWHQDNGYAYVEPQQYLTCWIALTDATEENGCPWVVPGVHRMGTLQHRLTETGLVCFDDAADAVPVPVRAGGIVVFSSLTPHCTGPNRTRAVRKAYIVQYAPDGARVLSGSPDDLRAQPADAATRQFPILIGGQLVSG